jgi:serine/threonine protein kinase
MPRKTSLKKRKSNKINKIKTINRRNSLSHKKLRILKGSFRGGSCRDVYGISGKKLCSDRYTYYFGNCFSGSNYWVYTLCEDKELSRCDNLLVKIRPISEWVSKESILKEADYLETASRLGVSPRLIGVDFCSAEDLKIDNDGEIGFISMEKYGEGSLSELFKTEYFREHIIEIKDKLKTILDILYDNRIDHNDLHSGNFLYSFKDGEIEFKIIDFDSARPFIPGSRRKYNIFIIDRELERLPELNVDKKE